MLGSPKRPLSALTERWPQNRVIFRIHHERFAANWFNDTGIGNARFSPFLQGKRAVPHLYGAASLKAALWETVFHDVDVRPRGRKEILREGLRHLYVSQLAPARPLLLAKLHSNGLHRLAVQNKDLVESQPGQYPRTREWALALYEDMPGIDGLVWMSRRYNSERAIVLFADRAPELIQSGPSLNLLNASAAWNAVLAEAYAAGISIAG